jgi:uncharacterized protein with von Willebrand factor type A (vWA) domain
MSFVTPNSKSFFESGLAKSAFKNTIYDGLPLDVYMPSINSVMRMFYRIASPYTKPKFYHLHDAYFLFYKPFEKVVRSLKKQNKLSPLWTEIINNVVKRSDYMKLNEITAGSDTLAVIAAARFLASLFDVQYGLSDKFDKRDATMGMLSPRQREKLEQAISNGLGFAFNLVVEYKNMVDEAEAAVLALGGRGGDRYTKEALSVLRFLENPDGFRRRVRILTYAYRFYRRFLEMTPSSLSHQQQVSLVGGVNGVTKMTSERQLSDILPSELVLGQLGDVGRALLAIKIAQKQLTVYQRAATIKPVIFVDKSGSMADQMPSDIYDVPKISMAAGLALALHRKYNAEVYLFDTELERVKPTEVVETLLKIDADGGTDIDPVLKEITSIGKPDYTYIIISDGITEASEEVLRSFESSGLAKRTKLILIDRRVPTYNWVKLLAQHSNIMLADTIVAFEHAVKRSLS